MNSDSSLSQPGTSHQEWGELAAGHALHALGPQEQHRLLAHLKTCEHCRAEFDNYTLIAAQLASLAESDEHEVQPPSWRQIRDQVVGAAQQRTEPTAPPISDALVAKPALPAPRRAAVWRRPRVLAAAAVLVLAAAGITGWQLATRSDPAPLDAAIAACQQQSDCRVVPLRSGTAESAAVIVDAGRASLVPLKLGVPPGGQMYVLWQLPRDGSPTAIATLRRTNRQTATSPLRASYPQTAAFAVSLELAGRAPARPTDILALGAASG